ncbi:hypothetical protein QFC21_002596 [Naganishia friedmannii]|uniref:Uncharacterized protein n=1 Tax=Naganishia friedmannii TaxID=89922 RepID=A0ACC2VVT9_9TREE|nr:hypothetical protein QFC21_002596 [Naganishia friedmannii]
MSTNAPGITPRRAPRTTSKTPPTTAGGRTSSFGPRKSSWTTNAKAEATVAAHTGSPAAKRKTGGKASQPASKKVTKTALSTVARRGHSPNVVDRPSSPLLNVQDEFANLHPDFRPPTAETTSAGSADGEEETEVQRLRRMLKQREQEALRHQQEKEEAQAQLSMVQRSQVDQPARVPVYRAPVKRMRRPTRQDEYVDAPMKEILGLGIVGLDKVADAILIHARRTLYQWVMATTHRVIWDGYAAKEDKYRFDQDGSWSSIGEIKRNNLLKRTQTDIWDIVPTTAASVIGRNSVAPPALRAARASLTSSAIADDDESEGGTMSAAGGGEDSGSGSGDEAG